MTEAFLHYVWQYQYFNKADLATTLGEPVSVFAPGLRNSNAGPDFFNARVRINNMDWVGNVEIHIHSSGWADHRHDDDAAYDNVILHAVWDEDKKIYRKDGTLLPTIELKHRVDDALLLRYNRLLNTPGQVPCAAMLKRVSEVTKISAVNKALLQRMEMRARKVAEAHQRNGNDWEETTYQLIARNFGFKVNAEPFEQLALALPYKLILKHADRPLQVEAMLFGQAGFLEEKGSDEYFLNLKREYTVLSAKYGLAPGRLTRAQWRFLRLRPANFPTLRIAQLAALLCAQKNIFSRIIEAWSYRNLRELFSFRQSEYWRRHYRFGAAAAGETVPGLGTSSVDNVVINSIVPLLVAYGRLRDEQLFIDRAIEILENVPPENNSIAKNWSDLGVAAHNAADSQGLIELYNNFCLKRRCLDCNIGFTIIQPRPG